jgi:hypothetical protein
MRRVESILAILANTQQTNAAREKKPDESGFDWGSGSLSEARASP